MSRGPLREATQRLVQEGVLTATPGRGSSVSILAPEHVPDLYAARGAVETQAVRMITTDQDHATAAIRDLGAAYDTLVTASARTGDADIAFHQAPVDAAGSRRLSHYLATLALETRIASRSGEAGYFGRRNVSVTYIDLVAAIR